MKFDGKSTTVQVVINGKIFTMGGYENEAHIHKVASYVNHINEELSQTNAYKSLPSDMKPIFIEINIADALIKAEDQMAQLEEDLRLKEAELSEVKQALVEAQLKLEQRDLKNKNYRR